MVDTRSPEQRSENMARVRGKDTGPELLVRRLANALGYRYRLHVATLPGSPDLVFPRYRSVIFVNGCFWHGHECRRGALPASNVDFWARKVGATKERDTRTRTELEREGWRVLTLWECELANRAELVLRIKAFLSKGEGPNHDCLRARPS